MSAITGALGKHFLIAALLPALIFLILNVAFIMPALPEVWPDVVAQASLPYMEDLPYLIYVFVPVVIGGILMAMNTPLIKLYEGAFGWQKGFLLKPLLKRNRARRGPLYRDLLAYQTRLRQVKQRLRSGEVDEAEKRELEEEKWDLGHAIDNAYMQVAHGLYPADESRLLPTRLGNAWAMIEEYPRLRYGMDGTSFWTRLVPIVKDKYGDELADEKTSLDFLLNLSFLTTILGVEFLATGLYRLNVYHLAAVPICLGLAYFLYDGAVWATKNLGEIIKSCFDLYRDELLAEFGFEKPAEFWKEQELWDGLGKFLLTGDSFYYVQEKKKSEKQSLDETDDLKVLQQELRRRTRNLNYLKAQSARYGTEAPLELMNAIWDEEDAIRDVEQRIAAVQAQMEREEKHEVQPT